MNVLLIILKILGIAVLAVLGLAILLLILVLCVPIRYDVKARYKDEARARVRIHWLLKLVLAKLEWMKDCGLIRAKVLWFTLYRKKLGDWGPKDEKPAEEKPEAEKPAETKPAEPAEKPETAAYSAGEDTEAKPETSVETAAETGAEAAETPAEPAGTQEAPLPETGTAAAEETAAQTEEQDEEDDLFGEFEKEQAAAEAEKPEEEKKSAGDKFRELEAKFYEFEDFIYDDKNIRTFEILRKQLKKLGKHFLPTELKIEGDIGFKDPALTGRVVGAIYCLYAINGEHVRVNGVYDREVLTGYLEVKGRLRLGIFVEIGVRLLLNKNFRHWLKYLLHRNDPPKTEEKTDEGKQEETKEEQDGKQ